MVYKTNIHDLTINVPSLRRIPGRLFQRRLSALCDANHWEVGCRAAGPVVMVPGPCRPGPFTTEVGP